MVANRTTTAKKDKEPVTDTVPNANTSGDLAAQWSAEFEAEGAREANPDVNFHKFEKANGDPNPIRGILLERRQRTTDKGEPDQFYFILGLTGPTTLFDSDGKEIEADKGDFAWVDQRWCLNTLTGYLPETSKKDGLPVTTAVHEVLIIPTKKVKLPKGRSMWKAKVHVIPRHPTAEMPLLAPKVNQAPPSLTTEEQGDIPF